jgi:hypothetical protein
MIVSMTARTRSPPTGQANLDQTQPWPCRDSVSRRPRKRARADLLLLGAPSLVIERGETSPMGLAYALTPTIYGEVSLGVQVVPSWLYRQACILSPGSAGTMKVDVPWSAVLR